MTNLLEKLKQRKSQQQQAPALGQTEAASKLLAAKSGKAPTGPTTPIDTEMERAVAGQTQQQLSDISQQGRIESAEIAGRQEQLVTAKQQGETKVAVGKEALASERTKALADMRQQLSVSFAELGLDKERADMESRVFAKRMQSDEYIRDLVNDRTLDRAFTEGDRRTNLLEMQLGEDLITFFQEMGFTEKMIRSDVDWESEMQKLKSEHMVNMAEKTLKGQTQRAIFEGAGEIGGKMATSSK